jgi:hypothetical protein
MEILFLFFILKNFHKIVLEIIRDDEKFFELNNLLDYYNKNLKKSDFNN